VKRIFIDANILVAVLNKEYPLYSNAARVLSLGSLKGYEIYTSTVCLAIAWYFAEKKNGNLQARSKIRLLAKHIHVCDTGAREVEKVLDNPAIHDFEDGLEYYSALEAGCTIIATENKEDFYFSEIAIYNSEELVRYVRESA